MADLFTRLARRAQDPDLPGTGQAIEHRTPDQDDVTAVGPDRVATTPEPARVASTPNPAAARPGEPADTPRQRPTASVPTAGHPTVATDATTTRDPAVVVARPATTRPATVPADGPHVDGAEQSPAAVRPAVVSQTAADVLDSSAPGPATGSPVATPPDLAASPRRATVVPARPRAPDLHPPAVDGATAAGPPTVQVHIGRLDIRATPPQRRRRAATPTQTPGQSLSEWLHGDRGRP